MKRFLSQTVLDRLFRIAVVIKGLNGLVEITGGIMLLAVPAARLGRWVGLISFEFSEAHHDSIAGALMTLDHSLTPGLALLAALYLIGHGLIKIGLVIALLRERYRVYPYAIAFMLMFIFYQSYRVGVDHSIWLAGLTAFDGVVAWLIYLEWRRHATPKKITSLPLPPLPREITRHKRFYWLSAIGVTLIMSGLTLALAWPALTRDTADDAHNTFNTGAVMSTLNRDVKDFEDRQTNLHTQLVSHDHLANALTQIQTSLRQGRRAEARQQIAALRSSLATWNRQLTTVGHESIAATSSPSTANAGVFIPIMLYHYTPANFEQQLAHLEQHGYTVVDLDQVATALSGGPALPAKPAVITFDDGFADQMKAFAILQRHHMKATYYIINGGAASKWCIGAGRRYGDPLQPAGGCGDAYLTWDQVRQLDRSGLIAIAGHTLDHTNLPSLPLDEQRHEIADSKAGIEQQIGHPIRHFAYPYGAFNATTEELVRQAGYVTATTVQPGDHQTPGSLYSLRRLRDTLTLP